MKKYLYIAIAAATLSSCSQDDTLDAIQGEAISFSNAFIENSTRAIDPSFGANGKDLTSFRVWGEVEGSQNGTATWVSIFKNDEVTGSVGDDVWNCDKTQYWIVGADYQFAAVVNGGTDESKFTYTNNLPSAVTFTSTDGQTDLMYAGVVEEQGATSNNPVNFNFNHMLAKAVFSVENTTNKGKTETSNYYYKISEVKILNPKTTGTCTFASKAWTSTSQATGSVYEFGNVTNASSKSTDALTTAAIEIHDRDENKTSHRECMLIPHNYNETNGLLQVSFKVQLYMEVDNNADNDVLISEETKTPTVAVNFQAGYSYNFNIKVGIGNQIQFTVTSQPTWTDATGEPEITV